MAHLCINCNSPKVTRNGDTFTCAQCKYTWDVAHEQVNAAYLAAQGRQPAASVLEPVDVSNLDAALGLMPPVEKPTKGAGALYEVPGPITTIDDDGAIRVLLHEPHPLTPEEADQAHKVLESKTVAEIEDIAGQAGIDLADARLKADKVQALIESGRVVLADDGATVIVVNDDETNEEAE